MKTLKNAPTCFEHMIILRQHTMFLATVIIKTFSELLLYVNFGAVAACRVFVCESYAVQNEPGYGCALYAVQHETGYTAYDAHP